MRIVLSLLFCCFLSACEGQNFSDSTGNTIKINDQSGRLIMLNYWATWCKPCIKEIPEFNQFAEKHQKNIRLYGVNFDQAQGDELVAQIQALNIQFPVFSQDPSSSLGLAPPQGLPTTMVLTDTGKLVLTLEGAQTEASLEQALSKIL